MTNTARTPVGDKLRALADEVDQALYAENDRGGDARMVLHRLYMDLVDDGPNHIVGWEVENLQARANAIHWLFEGVEKQRDALKKALEKAYFGSTQFEALLENLTSDEEKAPEELADAVLARVRALKDGAQASKERADEVVEKLRQRDAELAHLRSTLSGVQREASALRLLPTVPKGGVALTEEMAAYRDRVFEACRKLIDELPDGAYTEESAVRVALRELRDRRQVNEAANRMLERATTRLEESKDRERDLEAQVARLSKGEPADEAPVADKLLELVNTGFDEFVRFLERRG